MFVVFLLVLLLVVWVFLIFFGFEQHLQLHSTDTDEYQKYPKYQ